MGIFKDRTGQRFGKLVCIEPDGKAGRHTVWKCRCDCGTITRVSTSHLGKITNSCGCLGPDRRPLKVRFEERIEFDTNGGCWLWTGGLGTSGYGHLLGEDQKFLTASRASWLLYRGEIPAGMHVCHRCDIRACVNPDHLFLGSHTDNMRDMFAKGRRRAPRGELNPRAKLSPEQVLAIRDDPRRQIDIAAEYGVGQARVSAIKRGGWRSYAA